MMWSYFIIVLVEVMTACIVTASDAFCGIDYFQAVSDCSLGCPSGEDLECSDLGPEYSCFLFTGCSAKSAVNNDTADATNSSAFDMDSTPDLYNNSTIFDNDLNGTILPTIISPVTSNPVKTKGPTVSHTPNPYLTSLKTSTREEINGKAGSTLTSYGYIFNMKTTANSSAVEVVGLEFLTASTDELNFELYSTIGSYKGIKGNYDSWILVGNGTVQGQGFGQLTSIPSDLIDSLPMDGQGSSRAFYLTLSTKDIIFRATSIGTAPDEMVQLVSAEIELYEGESVQTYPFPDDETAGAYMGPAQFVGAIHYETVPCKPIEDYGTIYKLPCPIIPTISPAASTTAPTTMSPTLSFPITPESTFMPITLVPTTSPPPTISPTRSPIKANLTEVNVLITLRNIMNRNMTEPEEDSFIYELLEFFFLFVPAHLRVVDAKLWYQKTVEWMENSRRHRLLQGLEYQTLVSREFTMILNISYFGNYKDAEISSGVLKLLQENKSDFIIALRGTDTSYFTQVDAIQVKTIEAVELSTISALSTEGEVQPDLPQGSNNGVYAGVAIGVLTLCGLAIGLTYRYMKKRYDEKEYNSGNTNDSGSIDIETGELRPSNKSIPNFIPPIENCSDRESDPKSKRSNSSKGSDDSAEVTDENPNATPQLVTNNSQNGNNENSIDSSDASKSSTCSPDHQSVAEERNSDEDSHGEELYPEPVLTKKKKKKKKKIKKKRVTKKTAKKKDAKKKLKKKKSRKTGKSKKPASMDEAIAAIIAQNKVQAIGSPDDSSSSYYSSSEESDSDSSVSTPQEKMHWKSLQQAVKKGDVSKLQQREEFIPDESAMKSKTPNGIDNWKKFSKAVKSGDIAGSGTESKSPPLESINAGAHSSTEKKLTKKRSQSLLITSSDQKEDKRESLASKKNHWKTLSRSINTSENKTGEIRGHRHRSSSMIIPSSSTDKDHWENLQRAVKNKDFANSDGDLMRTSQIQSSGHDKFHSSDVNLNGAPMRKSMTTTRKKDNWKSLRESVRANEHKSDEPKTPRNRSRSVIISSSSKNNDHWKNLQRAVKNKDFANSDGDLMRTSQIQSSSHDNFHSSDVNLKSRKKDNWKSLRESVRANEHRSVDRSGRESMRRHTSRKESTRAMSRDSALRSSTRDGLRRNSSNIGEKGSDVLRRSSSEMRRSSSELRQSSRNSSSNDLKRRDSSEPRSNELRGSKRTPRLKTSGSSDNLRRRPSSRNDMRSKSVRR